LHLSILAHLAKTIFVNAICGSKTTKSKIRNFIGLVSIMIAQMADFSKSIRFPPGKFELGSCHLQLKANLSAGPVELM